MSIRTDDTSITISRGDSAEIIITPYLEDGDEPYLLGEGEKVVFAVETLNREQAVITKTADTQDETGAVSFSLSPEETELPRGSYCWTAKLIDESGELIDTFIGGISLATFYVK